MVTVREKVEIRIKNRTAVVDVERSRCKNCNEVFYTPEQMDAAQMAAAEQLRDEEQLLGPADIRRIRLHYGLTQEQLEMLLGVGPKTVVRWERGTVFQSRTADQLLRLIIEMPFVFEHLARKNGIVTTPNCPSQSGNVQQTSQFHVAAGAETRERHNRRVVDIAAFRTRADQRKQVRFDREASLPQIPAEALR